MDRYGRERRRKIFCLPTPRLNRLGDIVTIQLEENFDFYLIQQPQGYKQGIRN